MAFIISKSRLRIQNIRAPKDTSVVTTPAPQGKILLQDGSGYVAPESGTGGTAIAQG